MALPQRRRAFLGRALFPIPVKRTSLQEAASEYLCFFWESVAAKNSAFVGFWPRPILRNPWYRLVVQRWVVACCIRVNFRYVTILALQLPIHRGVQHVHMASCAAETCSILRRSSNFQRLYMTRATPQRPDIQMYWLRCTRLARHPADLNGATRAMKLSACHGQPTYVAQPSGLACCWANQKV